ncbi:MAG: hypothetical protein HXN77_09675 [Prevotella pallens]|uniref:hypothetical protein n=1 Tax=Prevotella pallens TaxID=60133 RepID=UPI001CB66787|nr:hypothetical protein [Prevotella pallens]MBF1490752.1 hypothetical protein [Prevotella pallens]
MSSLADIMNTSGTRSRRRGSGVTTPTQQPTQTVQPQQTDTPPTVQPAQGEVSAQQPAAQPATAPPQPMPGEVQPIEKIPQPAPISSWLPKDVPPTAEENNSEQENNPYQRMSLEQIARTLYESGKPSPEEEERQRKRERSRAILSAIGDGVSALSNLYHTSKYAPDMSTPDSSLSGKAKERYDRFVQVRKENEARYNNAILRARQGDYEMNMKEREIARKEAADAAKDAREAKRYEEQAKAKLEEIGIRRAQAQTAADKAAADAAYKKAQQEFNQKKFEADTALKKEQLANQRAANAERARHNRTVEGLSRERNNISRSKGGGKNSGGADASDMYYISGRHFTIGRKKTLSQMEQDAIYQYAVNRGWVDKKNQNAVNLGSLKKGDVIAKLANYTPQAKQYLIDNYGYTEINNGKSLGLKHNKGKKILGLK